jgi:hypothetical protein
MSDDLIRDHSKDTINDADVTGKLRFVIRDGHRILQQQWLTVRGTVANPEPELDWRDVPLVEDESR